MIQPLLTFGLLARALFVVLNSPPGDVRRNNSIGVGCTGSLTKYGVDLPDIARDFQGSGSQHHSIGNHGDRDIQRGVSLYDSTLLRVALEIKISSCVTLMISDLSEVERMVDK